MNITKYYNSTTGRTNYTITVNTSANMNPYDRSFNWQSTDSIGDICKGWGSLCPFDEKNFDNTFWIFTLLLAPWILIEYIGKIFYLEMWNINNNIIAYINDVFYDTLGYTIPYVYWWFSAIVLYIGTVYTVMGLAVGGFCAAETFSPGFV